MEYVILLLKCPNKDMITPSFLKNEDGTIKTYADYSTANFAKSILKAKFSQNWYAIGVYNLPEKYHE